MKRQPFFTLGLIALSIISCKQDYSSETSNENNSAEKLVRATSITPLKHPLPILATGKVSSKQEISLSFKTGGIVQRLFVDEADEVKKGQLLAQLNLSEINSQVVSARNAFEKSKRDLRRATNLYQDTVGTLEQKQNAETAKEIAESNLNIANFNLQYSRIKSPVNGTIFNRQVEEGELVRPGQPIYLVGSSGQSGSQIIRLGVSDKDIGLIQMGDTAIVKFDAFGNRPIAGEADGEFTAMVSEIGQSSNSNTGLFEVELTLDNYYPEIKNGFIANIKLFPSLGSQQFKIPMNALVEGVNRNAYLFFTTDDKTVRKVSISIDGFSEDFFTVSSAAIPENAKIITEGAPYLQVNDTIKIIP